MFRFPRWSNRRKAAAAATLALLLWIPQGISQSTQPVVTGHSTFYNGEGYDPCLASIAGIVKTVASGQSIPNFTPAMLEDMNAKHAAEHANVTRAETLALHKKGAAAAAAVVRGLSDAELDRSGTVLTGMPAMTTQQVVENILINHVKEHLTSIRATLNR